MVDFKALVSNEQAQYFKQIERVQQQNGFTNSIEKTVQQAEKNLTDIENPKNSFVIYGEPQSGKTEMMICLVAKLLDVGFRGIVVLVNDSIDLKNQNLKRFKTSNLSPAPFDLVELLDSALDITKNPFIVFAKKNSKDLEKLKRHLRSLKKVVVIDDEADFATPNNKINKGEETKINSQIKQLVDFKSGSVYIGVTATPARLDLNNSLENERAAWINFEPHPEYCGNDVFFPINRVDNLGFELIGLQDDHSQVRDLREAITGFLVNVAHLNSQLENLERQNYVMIIHTSGKVLDHKEDKKIVDKYFSELSDTNSSKFQERFEEIEKLAISKYGVNSSEDIVKYIFEQRRNYSILEINTTIDRNLDVLEAATNPQTPFTIAIGGNIISRGVTFNNLLSMYFTRTAKKIQQDTYIQRARMFGSRKKYLDHFQLHIPKSLYLDWADCFDLHRLALASVQSGTPIWLESTKIRPVAKSSIDKLNVVEFAHGGFPFDLLDFTSEIRDLTNDSKKGIENFNKIINLFPKDYGANYLLKYLSELMKADGGEIIWHKSRDFSNYADGDQSKIVRTKGGMMGTEGDLEIIQFPKGIFHFKLFYNKQSKARLYYRSTRKEGRLRFVSWRAKNEK